MLKFLYTVTSVDFARLKFSV